MLPFHKEYLNDQVVLFLYPELKLRVIPNILLLHSFRILPSLNWEHDEKRKLGLSPNSLVPKSYKSISPHKLIIFLLVGLFRMMCFLIFNIISNLVQFGL